MIRILRVVINSLILGLRWIKKFFSLISLRHLPTFRRLTLEFVDSQGGERKVVIEEIRRIVQRIERDYNSLATYLPPREVFKRFIKQPVRKHLFERSPEERINAIRNIN